MLLPSMCCARVNTRPSRFQHEAVVNAGKVVGSWSNSNDKASKVRNVQRVVFATSVEGARYRYRVYESNGGGGGRGAEARLGGEDGIAAQHGIEHLGGNVVQVLEEALKLRVRATVTRLAEVFRKRSGATRTRCAAFRCDWLSARGG